MKKKIVLFIFLLALGIASGSWMKAKAGTGDNVTGWLWGGSQDGLSPSNYTGVGWIGTNSTNTSSPLSYGLNIPASDGPVTGYAWSENLGWISFNAADLSGCPSAPCSAQRAGNKLQGWARIISIRDAATAGNSGGWQGWIKLSSVSGDPVSYGVTMNADGTITKGQNTSYAWSNELGWIDFSRTNLAVSAPAGFIVCPQTATVFTGNTLQAHAYYIASGVIDCTNYAGATDVTASATWSSDNIPVASVSGGNITGVSVGSATITASYTNGTTYSGIVQATVSAPPVTCGDGVVNGTEQCDDGANNGSCPKTCSSTCTINNCGTDNTWKEVAP
jgi:hypothetical protein